MLTHTGTHIPLFTQSAYTDIQKHNIYTLTHRHTHIHTHTLSHTHTQTHAHTDKRLCYIGSQLQVWSMLTGDCFWLPGATRYRGRTEWATPSSSGFSSLRRTRKTPPGTPLSAWYWEIYVTTTAGLLLYCFLDRRFIGCAGMMQHTEWTISCNLKLQAHGPVRTNVK